MLSHAVKILNTQPYSHKLQKTTFMHIKMMSWIPAFVHKPSYTVHVVCWIDVTVTHGFVCLVWQISIPGTKNRLRRSWACTAQQRKWSSRKYYCCLEKVALISRSSLYYSDKATWSQAPQVCFFILQFHTHLYGTVCQSLSTIQYRVVFPRCIHYVQYIQ